jgi:hypothetical protein
LARGESASVSARWAAAIQKVLRVGFLTHQVMVGFGTQSLQKSRNRSGDSSVYRTVCWMFLCPR